MAYYTWHTDQERPGVPFAIYDTDGTTLLSLGSGYTATVQLVRAGTTTLVVTQTTDLALASTSPNLTISKWAAATLAAVAADLTAQSRTAADYEIRPYIRQTSDTSDEVPTSDVRLVGTFKAAAA